MLYKIKAKVVHKEAIRLLEKDEDLIRTWSNGHITMERYGYDQPGSTIFTFGANEDMGYNGEWAVKDVDGKYYVVPHELFKMIYKII